MDDTFTQILVSLGRQDEQLKLLPEMRKDVSALREDMTALKTKVALVATAISGAVALLSQFIPHVFGGK